MPREIGLLDGRMGWSDYQEARERFLSGFVRRFHHEHRGTTMDVQTFVDAWNAHDPAALAARYADDGVRHQLALPEARLAGREAIAQGCGALMHASPDGRLDVRSQGTDQDGRVTMEWTFTGTLQNDLPGLPANGNAFTLPGISVYTLDGDGLIVLENVYWDTATLLAAAGVLGG